MYLVIKNHVSDGFHALLWISSHEQRIRTVDFKSLLWISSNEHGSSFSSIATTKNILSKLRSCNSPDLKESSCKPVNNDNGCIQK